MVAPALGAEHGRSLPEGEPASVDNPAGETIEGDRIGVYSRASQTTVTNAGTIRGNGSADGLDVLPEGGITLDGGPATITNSGTNAGAGHGISTDYFSNTDTPAPAGQSVVQTGGAPWRERVCE